MLSQGQRLSQPVLLLYLTSLLSNSLKKQTLCYDATRDQINKVRVQEEVKSSMYLLRLRDTFREA